MYAEQLCIKIEENEEIICPDCKSKNIREISWVGIDPLNDNDTICQCKDCKTVFLIY
jgi:hypothetical protein